MIQPSDERFRELSEEYWDCELSKRVTRSQRLISVAAWYLQRLSPVDVVWSQDAAKWLRLADPEDDVSDFAAMDGFDRLAELGLTLRYREQFDRRTKQPARIFHQLTELGTVVSILRIQELRADAATRPSWMLVPEDNDGRWEPVSLAGFAISQPSGELTPEQY